MPGGEKAVAVVAVAAPAGRTSERTGGRGELPAPPGGPAVKAEGSGRKALACEAAPEICRRSSSVVRTAALAVLPGSPLPLHGSRWPHHCLEGSQRHPGGVIFRYALNGAPCMPSSW